MQECICGGLNSGCSKCGGGGFITKNKKAYSPTDQKEIERLLVLETFPKIIRSLGPSFFVNVLGEISLDRVLSFSDEKKLEIHYKILQTKNTIKLQSQLKSETNGIADPKQRELLSKELSNIDAFNTRDQILLRDIRSRIVKQIEASRNVKQQAKRKNGITKSNQTSSNHSSKPKKKQLELAVNSAFRTKWIHIF